MDLVLCTKEFADEYSLMHYRTRGSKNGVRRYQDENGNYTAEGYRHYADMYGWGNNNGGGNYYQQAVSKSNSNQPLMVRNTYNQFGPVRNSSGPSTTVRNSINRTGTLRNYQNQPVTNRNNLDRPASASAPVLARTKQGLQTADRRVVNQLATEKNNVNRPTVSESNKQSQKQDPQKQINDWAWSARRVNEAGGLQSREGRQIVYGNPILSDDYKKHIAKYYGDSDGKSYPKSLEGGSKNQVEKPNANKLQSEEKRVDKTVEPRDSHDTTGQFGRGNIDLNNRKVVRNEDGSISTERSFSVNIDGKETLLPTVIDGRIVSEDEAYDHYLETGEHLGQFDTVEEAEAYAEALHNRQDWYYNQRKKGQDKKSVGSKR